MPYLGEFAALSAAACWSVASLLFARLGTNERLDPRALNLFKCALAFVLLWLTMALSEGVLLPSPHSHGALVALATSGVIGLTLGDTSYFHALIRLGPRRTLIFATLGTPTTAILARIFLDEPLTLHMLLGIGVTLAGVIWVILERQPAPISAEEIAVAEGDKKQKADAGRERKGIMFALVAMLCQAAGNILTKYGSESMSALQTSTTRLFFGVIALIVWAMMAATIRQHTGKILRNSRTLATLTLATVLGTYLGIWLLVMGLQHTENTGVAATLSSMSPVFILPLTVVFLRERVSLRACLGALVAVSGVILLIVGKNFAV